MVDLAAVGWSGLLYGAGFGLTAASLLVSCWIDLRYRLVCDEACLAALVGGILMMFGGRSLGSLWYWAALLAVVVVLGLLFAARLLGGGDLKLMVALLPGLGAWPLAVFIVWTSIAGGALALGYRIATAVLRRRTHNPASSKGLVNPRRGTLGLALNKWLRHESARIRRGKSIPYVPAIAAGWLVAQMV
jgi:Flp pilus assembly protein protease CpaA